MSFQETTSTFQRTYGSSAGVFVATNAVRWNEIENMFIYYMFPLSSLVFLLS